MRTTRQIQALRHNAECEGDLTLAAICALALDATALDGAEDGTEYDLLRGTMTQEQALQIVQGPQSAGEYWIALFGSSTEQEVVAEHALHDETQIEQFVGSAEQEMVRNGGTLYRPARFRSAVVAQLLVAAEVAP
jgi:hypothetical protein